MAGAVGAGFSIADLHVRGLRQRRDRGGGLRGRGPPQSVVISARLSAAELHSARHIGSTDRDDGLQYSTDPQLAPNRRHVNGGAGVRDFANHATERLPTRRGSSSSVDGVPGGGRGRSMPGFFDPGDRRQCERHHVCAADLGSFSFGRPADNSIRTIQGMPMATAVGGTTFDVATPWLRAARSSAVMLRPAFSGEGSAKRGADRRSWPAAVLYTRRTP